MAVMLILAVVLISLHAPNGDRIDINPDTITSMHGRVPQRKGDAALMAKEIECLINLSDGKYVSVVEKCDEVRELIKGASK
jgi:hypothetical protein